MSGRRTRAPVLAGLLATLGGAAAAASLAGLLEGRHWLLDLVVHFEHFYAAALALAAPALLLLGARRRAFVLFAVLAFDLWDIAPYYLPRSVDAGPETLTLLWFNVNVGNPRRAAVGDYVERSGADAVALIEISDGWLEDLAALAASYPHRLVEPRGDGFGMALLSRRPLSDGTIAYHPAAGVPTISASLPLAGTPVRLHVVHPLAPVSAQMTRLRDRHLADLAFELAADSRSSVVLGDFNTTPYSRHYRRLARLAALTDCNRGHGLPLTWPTTTPVLRIPLDLCLASPDLLAIEATVGPDLGSDHLPRQVALARVQP